MTGYTDITHADFIGQMADMLRICFEGEVVEGSDAVTLRFPDGQQFCIRCEKISCAGVPAP